VLKPSDEATAGASTVAARAAAMWMMRMVLLVRG
jgi:hypothetical protein